MLTAKEAKKKTKNRAEVLNEWYRKEMNYIYQNISSQCENGFSEYTTAMYYDIGSQGIEILNRQKEELEKLDYSVQMIRRIVNGEDFNQMHLRISW